MNCNKHQWGVNMNISEKASLCAIHNVDGIGSRTLFKLKEQYDSFTACLESDLKDLQKNIISPTICDNIIKSRYNAASYFESLEESGIKVVTFDEKEYPKMLRNIDNPPYLLYAKGEISLLNEDAIAIVGTRLATMYGKKVAFKFGRELADQGIVTVSGMARGVDTEAHKGSLESNGRTIAVLGSGINVIYPRDNTKLYNEICNKGLVISEFAPFTQPNPGNFPMRNRIISGLSYGVIVVEAKLRSGALITADFALEQGRDVFAIPGPITSKNSEGTNNLIKQGAKLVNCIADIFEEYYDIKLIQPAEIVQDELPLIDEQEAALLKLLDFEPMHFDELINITSFSVGDLNMILLNLEFKGMVKSMPGNYYVKVSDFLTKS